MLKLLKNGKIVRNSFRFYCKSIKSNYPLVLGIETSCDDTGASVVDGKGNILSNVIHSQLNSHLTFGGIIPPVAQDFHRQNIEAVVNDSLKKANVDWSDIDYISVTNRPGLTLCLLVGLRYAKHLARKHSKPLIPIHHMEAHALCARMQHKDIQFPFLCLLISGGHCLLVFFKDINTFYLLGESLDDAPGEAFDKVARRLKLRNLPEYEWCSGGVAIEKAAKLAQNTEKYKFPLPLNRYRDCQFSFAGMKNTARRFIMQEERQSNLVGSVMPDYPDFCASFLAAVTRHLCHRTQRAIQYCEIEEMFTDFDQKSLVVSGGVAANDFIFNGLTEMCSELGFKTYRPTRNLCTDNGCMIAWNGVEKILANQIPHVPNLDLLEVNPRCPLGESHVEKVKAKQLHCKWVKIPSLKRFAFA